MKKKLLSICALIGASCAIANAQTGYAGITHEMSEFYEPVPKVVTPGNEIKGGGFTAPSDAIVLIDGKDLSAWERQGRPSRVGRT